MNFFHAISIKKKLTAVKNEKRFEWKQIKFQLNRARRQSKCSILFMEFYFISLIQLTPPLVPILFLPFVTFFTCSMIIEQTEQKRRIKIHLRIILKFKFKLVTLVNR